MNPYGAPPPGQYPPPTYSTPPGAPSQYPPTNPYATPPGYASNPYAAPPAMTGPPGQYPPPTYATTPGFGMNPYAAPPTMGGPPGQYPPPTYSAPGYGMGIPPPGNVSAPGYGMGMPPPGNVSAPGYGMGMPTPGVSQPYGAHVLGARKLDRKDVFSKSDPFLKLVTMESAPVHKTETIMNNHNPSWRPFVVDISVLCRGGLDNPFIVEIWDWDRSGNHDFIGSTIITLKELMRGGEIPVHNPKKQGRLGYMNSGYLVPRKVEPMM